MIERVPSQCVNASMPEFVFEANIAHFKELLETERDPVKRKTLQRLLAEEEAKLARWLANRTPKEK